MVLDRLYRVFYRPSVPGPGEASLTRKWTLSRRMTVNLLHLLLHELTPKRRGGKSPKYVDFLLLQFCFHCNRQNLCTKFNQRRKLND